MARVIAMQVAGDALFVLQADGSVFGLSAETAERWFELPPVPRTEADGREATKVVRERAEAAGLHLPPRSE